MLQFEGVLVKLPPDAPFAIDRTKQNDPKGGYYTITNSKHVDERYFASAKVIS